MVGSHPVNCTIGHVDGHNSSAFPINHNEVHGEILYKEGTVIPEGSSKEGMEHTVAGSVCNAAGPPRNFSFSVIETLASERSLVNSSLFCPRERHSIGL